MVYDSDYARYVKLIAHTLNVFPSKQNNSALKMKVQGEEEICRVKTGWSPDRKHEVLSGWDQQVSC